MKQYFPKISLIILILIGLLLRLNNLTKLPPSLYSDEADIAYQAKTLNSCGTDYFGNFLPTRFHSFSDWQPPFYIYSVALAQKFFGVNEISTRLPSAIFGLLSIICFYFLLKKLFNETYGLLGTAFLVFNPWHIHFSRISFGVTGQIIFFILPLLFFFIYLKSKKLIHFSLFVCLNFLQIYFYSTAPITIFFTFLGVFILWFKELCSLKLKQYFLIFIFSFLVLLPFIGDTLSGKSSYRFNYISIFTDPTIPQQVDFQRQTDSFNKFGDQIGLTPSLFSKTIHNKIFSTLNLFTTNYLKSFSPEFLLIQGDTNLRQGFGNHGQLYLIEFVFILFGILVSFKKPSKISWLFLSFMLTIPIASSLTRDSNSAHATRLFLQLVPFGYFFTIGLNSFFKNKIILFISTVLYLISITNFWHLYQNHYPHYSAPSWDSGLKEVSLLSSQYPNQKIFFSSSIQNQLPFFLIWNKSSDRFLCQLNSNLKHVSLTHFNGLQLDNYFFGNIEWSQIINYPELKNSIFAIPVTEVPTVKSQLKEGNTFTILHQIDLPWQQSIDYQIIKIN